MTHYVIRLITGANGQRTEFDGYYVKEYKTPRMRADGTYAADGKLIVTRDRATAKRYPTAAQAWEVWRAQRGWRPDGKPNRPLTAWHAAIERV